MRRIALLATAVFIAGCGGGSDEQSKAPPRSPSPSGKGGVVTAEPTKGLLGPATGVDNGKPTLLGRGGALSPREDRPTDAQRNGVAGGVACASTTSAPSAANLRSISSAVLCLLNGERSVKGLPSLRASRQLRRAAQPYAARMVRQRFFSHNSPDGKGMVDRIRPTGYIRGSWTLGENLAWGSGALATPRAIVNGWMNSPGHRANILNRKFRDIGIGIKLGAPGRGLSGGATYVTNFGKRG